MKLGIESLLAAALASLISSSVAAGDISSTYTSLDLEKCRASKSPAEGGGAILTCNGYNGMPVQVAEDDLRYFVSYGANANAQTVARQTLTHFNTIHTTLEWRIESGKDGSQPFATILRYFWDRGDGGPKGETLVVTKLGADDACHMAYVNADGNLRANEMAREIADNRARGFDCKRDEVVTEEP